MNSKTASLLFLTICLGLAVLLLTDVITPQISGALFAVFLVIFGAASGGFRKRRQNKSEQP